MVTGHVSYIESQAEASSPDRSFSVNWAISCALPSRINQATYTLDSFFQLWKFTSVNREYTSIHLRVSVLNMFVTHHRFHRLEAW